MLHQEGSEAYFGSGLVKGILPHHTEHGHVFIGARAAKAARIASVRIARIWAQFLRKPVHCCSAASKAFLVWVKKYSVKFAVCPAWLTKITGRAPARPWLE